MNTEFARYWFERSQQTHREVDKTDQFLALWIAFNGYLKSKYGTRLTDATLISRFKQESSAQSIYREVYPGLDTSPALADLSNYSIKDMRFPQREDREIRFNGTFDKFIECIYRVRCNLFHGRKISAQNELDEKLVHLAHDLFAPYFKEVSGY